MPSRKFVARSVEFWHLASLDAPTVAVVWALALARSAHVHLEPWITFLLASGTWTVYVLDRILDARRAIHAHAPGALRERHHFHWRHRRLFIPIATCSGLAAVAIIVKLVPAYAREHDSVIAAAALAYFSGVHASARFPRWLHQLCSKEMLVGILFAAGCSAPTLTRLHPSQSTWPQILSLTFLAFLAWLNCSAISTWESQHSSSNNIPAAAALLAIGALAVAMVIASNQAPASTLLSCGALSALLLLALHLVRKNLAPVLLRALADFVLLVPAVLLVPGALPK